MRETRRWTTVALLLGVLLGLPAPVMAATAEPSGPLDGFLEFVLPLTPAQAREVLALAGSPGHVSRDARELLSSLGDVLVALPGAVAGDVVDTVPRHLQFLQALVADAVEVPAWVARGRPPGLGRRTVQALHRSATISALVETVRHLTRPENRSVRLVVAVAARAHGIPLTDGDLDVLRLALDRENPDLAPMLARALTRLTQRYGREALAWLIVR